MDVKSTWIHTCIKQIVFHGHVDYFLKPPLRISLTQNWETMALRNLPTVELLLLLLLFIMCKDPAWIEIH
jgi:hypothetical protein